MEYVQMIIVALIGEWILGLFKGSWTPKSKKKGTKILNSRNRIEVIALSETSQNQKQRVFVESPAAKTQT